MKSSIPLVLWLPLLAACGKQDAPTAKNDHAVPVVAPESGTSKYPTIKEEHLKGVVRTRLDSPTPTAAQLARRTKNNKTIRDMGLPVLDDLPVVEDEATVKFRNADDIAKRCLATTICAIKGETNDQEFVDKLLKDYSATAYLSPAEQKFVRDSNPARQDLVDFAWRYECVHVFLWAMGARDSIAKPNEICTVAEDMKLIKTPGPAKFVVESKRRPPQEILDMADYYYRLHWAAIELRIKGKNSDLLDEGVIRERHRALNWLIGYLNQDWDDVTTDT